MRGNIRQVGYARKATGYLFPFLERYDALREARTLLRDGEIRSTGFGEQDVAAYLMESQRRYRTLYNLAKFADSADRATSIFGAAIEMAGVSLGIAPGWISSGGEEAIEMLFKAPFLAYAAKDRVNRRYIPGILMREAASVTPVLGDVYDVVTNLYVRTANKIIREDTKRRILESRIVIKPYEVPEDVVRIS